MIGILGATAVRSASSPDRGEARRSSGAPADDLGHQALGLALQGQDVGTDRLQRCEGLRLVEIAGEADLVADFRGRPRRSRRPRRAAAPRGG